MVNTLIKILFLPKDMQLLTVRPSALIFLLTLLHMEYMWFSKLNSQWTRIPHKVYAVLEVIVVPLIDTTWALLKLSNKWCSEAVFQRSSVKRCLQLYWKRDSSTGVFLWILWIFLKNTSHLLDVFSDKLSYDYYRPS